MRPLLGCDSVTRKVMQGPDGLVQDRLSDHRGSRQAEPTTQVGTIGHPATTESRVRGIIESESSGSSFNQ